MKRTFGQIAVGLDFNPSGEDAVGIIKQKYADIIDMLHELRQVSTSSEQKRWASVGITEAEMAQMAAVKAVTWKDYVPPPLDFDVEVIEASKTKAVLVDFYLETCQPCHEIAPHLAKMAKDNGMEFVKIDCRQEKSIAQRFNVQGVPRIMVFNGGELHWDSVSTQWKGPIGTAKEVEAVILKMLGKAPE